MSTPAAADRLIQRVEQLRRAHPQRAWRTLMRDFATSMVGSDAAKRGELWRLRAHVLRSLRRTRNAVAAYHRADNWFERAGAVGERGRCAIGLVDALMYLGRHDEALQAATRGRRLLTRAGDRDALARLLNNEANVFHRLDLPDHALLRYREARRRLRQTGDARGAAMLDGNIANCFSMLGRCSEARRLYVQAQRVHQASGFELDALNAGYNLAYVDFLEHQYEAALEALSRLSEEAIRRGYPSIAALATLDRSEILLRMGAHASALSEAQLAMKRCAAIELTYEHSKAETFAALAEHRLGRPAAAAMRLERALASFHIEGNEVWMGETLVGLATVWIRDGNPRAAAALLSAARLRFSRAGDREREACCLAVLSGVWLSCGNLRTARLRLSQSLRLVGRSASPRLRHLTLAAEASIARASGDVPRARERLRRAASEAERLAARVLDEQWRSSFWGEWGWPHQELASLELREGRVHEALEALERGRGRALVGLVGRTRRGARIRNSVRAWAASHQAHDRRRLAQVESGAAPIHRQPTTPSRGGTLQRALHTHPTNPIRSRTLQRSLADGQVLVDYLLHDGMLGAIAVSQTRMIGRPHLTRQRELDQLVHALSFDLRSAMFKPPEERSSDRGWKGRLEELAALVLWPLLEDLKNSPDTTSLAIVPVGPLARLPWAALPLPDGRALCESMEIRVVPGLRLSMLSGTKTPVASDHGHRDPPIVIACDAGELENVASETRAVMDQFPGARLLSGAEASAERFLELAPRAAWIHFAGHGHFRADAPHESAIRFSDRWLLAAELADLHLCASWVGLSACQTARALVRPGEEWFGLARSFLVSGSRSVLASQWDIEDQAAARLMADVYQRAASGESLGRALAGTQAERSKGGTHPLDWAGFLMLGGLSDRVSDSN